MKLEAKCFLPLCAPTMIDFLRPGIVTAQNGSLETIDVYLDCERRTCDFDYIRREIRYVNYVRERTEAHIHLLVTTERTGLVRKIEEGLVRYISRTSIADRLEISVAPIFEEETVTSNPLDDPYPVALVYHLLLEYRCAARVVARTCQPAVPCGLPATEHLAQQPSSLLLFHPLPPFWLLSKPR